VNIVEEIHTSIITGLQDFLKDFLNVLNEQAFIHDLYDCNLETVCLWNMLGNIFTMTFQIFVLSMLL